MVLSILSLIFSVLALGISVLSLVKTYKLYQIYLKEDITTENENGIIINNKSF